MSEPESGRRQPTDLDSLLSLGPPVAEGLDRAPTGSAGELLEIPVDAIVANEFQPRRHFDEASLAALTASVRELGVLQPVLVRRAGTGRYELVAGERRWRAAKRAGLRSIPVIVRTAEDRGSLEQAIVENLHREDLTAIEEAAAYRQLVEDFGFTQDEVASRVGKSRSAVSNALRLFQLPPTVQRLVADGRLGGGHARAILGLTDPAEQRALADRVLAEGLSVRQVEVAVRAAEGRVAQSRPRDGGGGQVSKSAAALEVEAELGDRLSTRVVVEESAGNGRIVIRFADAEDLDRIYRLLGG